MSFSWGWRHVTIADDFALIATEVSLEIDMVGTQVTVPLRWTVALAASSVFVTYAARYHDIEVITQDLHKVSFEGISIEAIEDLSAAPSIWHPAVAYCQGKPLRNGIEARGAAMLDRVTDVAAEAITARHGDGQIAANISGHVITAVK